MARRLLFLFLAKPALTNSLENNFLKSEGPNHDETRSDVGAVAFND